MSLRGVPLAQELFYVKTIGLVVLGTTKSNIIKTPNFEGPTVVTTSYGDFFTERPPQSFMKIA